jgi:hypothetical protein
LDYFNISRTISPAVEPKAFPALGATPWRAPSSTFPPLIAVVAAPLSAPAVVLGAFFLAELPTTCPTLAALFEEQLHNINVSPRQIKKAIN